MLLELNKPIKEKDKIQKPPKRKKIVEETNYKKRSGYVYLMRSENGLYKIGRTINTRNRLSGLNREIPTEVKLIHAIECEDYIIAEQVLHLMFFDKRVKYEWFALDIADVDWFLKLDSNDIARMIQNRIPRHHAALGAEMADRE